MDRYLAKARHYLWIAAELAFLVVLVSVLIHIALGPNSGGFVQGVYDNLVAFGRDVPSATLLGVGSLMLLVWYIQQRTRENREERKDRRPQQRPVQRRARR